MGRNSVTPCTTARTMICSNDMPPSPACPLRGQVLYRGPSLRDSFSRATAARAGRWRRCCITHSALLPLHPARACRMRHRGRARRGAALGMARLLPPAQPGGHAARAHRRRARPDRRRLCDLRISRANQSAGRRRRARASSSFPAMRGRGPRRGGSSTGSIASSTTRSRAYLVEEKVYRRFGPKSASPDMEAMRAGHENLRYHLAYIGHLAETRSWLAGDALSFADLAAAAHLSALDYLGEVPWEEHEAAKNWYALLKSRPSFRPLLQDRRRGLPPVRDLCRSRLLTVKSIRRHGRDVEAKDRR